MYKDAMTIGITGVGLSAMSGLDNTGSIGKLGKGLGTVGSVVMMGHTVGILNDTLKKVKKK